MKFLEKFGKIRLSFKEDICFKRCVKESSILEENNMEKILNNSYFMIGSKVLTNKGYKDIAEITPNMKVLNGENEYHPVLEVQESHEDDVFELETMDNKTFEVTKNQFFWASQKKKGIFTIPQRKMACKLNRNDYLVTHYEQDGSGHIYFQYSNVKNTKPTNKKKKTYNLIVGGNHTYIVNNAIVCDNSIKVNSKN